MQHKRHTRRSTLIIGRGGCWLLLHVILGLSFSRFFVDVAVFRFNFFVEYLVGVLCIFVWCFCFFWPSFFSGDRLITRQTHGTSWLLLSIVVVVVVVLAVSTLFCPSSPHRLCWIVVRCVFLLRGALEKNTFRAGPRGVLILLILLIFGVLAT